MGIVLSNLSPLVAGLWITLSIAVLSFVGAMVIGTLVAVMRISPVAPLRAVGLVYVEFFRNIPLLCLLFLVVFGLPDIGVLFNLYNSAVIAMAMFSGAFVCESIRTGINTVQVGQAEAARSIGLTFGQSLRFVILPQALRSMVQPLVNVWIGTLIGSSLASVIGIGDVTAVGQSLNNRYAGGLAVFASIASIYVVIALLSGGVGGWIERRVAVQR
jgi:glutamate transport system permease protein